MAFMYYDNIILTYFDCEDSEISIGLQVGSASRGLEMDPRRIDVEKHSLTME